MYRYLLNVSYIGTKFRGIQRIVSKTEEQFPDTQTVQGCIELALQVLRPINKIETVISSRTDAGVHALHSTIHVDLKRPGNDTSPYETNVMTGVLNRTFGKNGLAIRILSTERVSDTFHSRYHAIGRTYLYRIAIAKNGISETREAKNKNFEGFIPIEELDRCFFINDTFDIERCKSAARMFLGRHDFRTFMSVTKSRDHPMFAIRHISDIEISPGKSLALNENAVKSEELYNYWNFKISGRSFLYKQVRRIIGTLVALATNRIDEKCIYEMLTIPSKHSWHPRILPAPPYGLYLCRVHYDPKDLHL